jgi:hypothetical protein
MLYRWGLKSLSAACMALAIAACSRPEPEAALRERVSALQDAIGARDPAAMQQFLSADFIGNDGMDRRAARAYAALLMRRHPRSGVVFGPLRVDMASPGHASVGFDAIATAGPDGPLPGHAGVYAVRTAWRDQDGEWMLYRAEWTRKL